MMRTARAMVFTALLLCAALALGMLPAAAMAENDFSVVAEPALLEITEGQMQLENNELIAHYESHPESVSTSFVYEWFSCDKDGANRQPAPGGNNGEHAYRVCEELAPGTYYFVCEVSGYDINSRMVDTVSSNVVKVVINAGTPLVIFDPAEGSFAEIGQVPIVVTLSNGKLPSSAPVSALEDFFFTGWYTSDDTLIADPENHTFTHTTRLFAKYSATACANFDAAGGSFGDGTSSCIVECPDGIMTSAMLPEDPTRDGYIFQGWYYAPSGTEYLLELYDGDVFELSYASVDFCAKWTPDASLPQTGDPTLPLFWLGLGVMSMTGLLLLRKKARA